MSTGTESPRHLVGLDFGGTAIKGGAITDAGEILAERSIPIELERGAESVLDAAAEFARELGVADALGVGCAGLLDRASGTVIESPNLTALRGVALGPELGRRLELEAPVRLENDANVAALGEQWIGAARGERDVLVVTLGTGVGGGLILDGRLFTGALGGAGEIGHVVVDPVGPRCGCGSKGCLEMLASATAARRRALERGLPAGAPGDLPLLAERAQAGSGPEAELLHEVGRDLGRGLSYASVLLDIPCFVFAGGFSAALDALRAGILEGLDERRFAKHDVRLLEATLGASAGWIGAARLLLHE